jgi:hypothetical protein
MQVIGFLTIAVGFLMTAALSAPLDETLSQLGKLEAERDQVLIQADSLGQLLSTVTDPGSSEGIELFQEGERLGQESADIELEILLVRRQCRSLARQELDDLRETSTTEALARSAALMDLLDRRLADDWGTDPVLVEPDRADGRETLLDKQAYLADIRDRLVSLQEGLSRRIDQARQEETLLRAIERFADETRFLDESGRVGSDPEVALRAGPGDPPDDDPSRNLITGGGVEDPGELRSVAPAIGRYELGDLASLQAAHAEIERDLNRVEEALRATEGLLLEFPNTTR